MTIEGTYSLRPCWHAALQLFNPVQHDVDLRVCRLRLLDGLDHQEALAIEAYVVVGDWDWRRFVRSLEEHPGRARSETRLRGNIHGHHLAAAAVEQLPTVRIPDRLRAAFRRDLPLAAWARIGLHINLRAAGFIRDIGQPAPVGGKLWRPFVEPCSEKKLRLAGLP